MQYLNSGYVQTKYFNYYAMLVIYTVLLLPFMGLSGLQVMMGGMAYSAYQSCAMVLLLVLVIFKVRRVPKDAFSWLYLAFNAVVFYATVQNYGFSMGILVSILAVFFVTLLIQRDGELIIRAITIIAVAALVANTITVFQLGIRDRAEYFVGGKNSMSIFFVPAAFMIMANEHIRKGRMSWKTICFIAAVVLTVFVTGSATGIVTVLALCVGMLWIRKFKPNVAVLMVGMIIIQIVLVLLIDLLSSSLLWIKVLDWLGKEETLTSRAMIWDQAIEMFKNDWLLGVGRGAKIRYTNSWGKRVQVTEAHNFFLELLLEGGVVGFILYMILILSVMKKLNMDSMLHRILFMCFVVILVNGLAEAVNNKIYVTLVLGLMNACSNGMLKDRHLAGKVSGKKV